MPYNGTFMLSDDGQIYITTDPVTASSVYRGGLAFDATGKLHVTSAKSASDVYVAGRRVTTTGALVVDDGVLAQRPYNYVAGLPFRRLDHAMVRQIDQAPAAFDPYVAGVRVGLLGGVYMLDTPPPVPTPVDTNFRGIVQAATTLKSVFGSSAVCSVAPGRLWGLFIASPGTAGTCVVYDNASGPSGTVLRTVAASELAQGAFIYCGGFGTDAANGLYISLGGTEAPIVVAIFEGEYPALPTHSGTVQYVDGTNGNDAWDGTTPTFVSGTTGPKRTWQSSWQTGAWQVFCKRGTDILIPDTEWISTNGDWLITDYGDGNASLPRLVLSTTKTNNFSFTATSGFLEWRNIEIISLLASGLKTGIGLGCAKGARSFVSGCKVSNFYNGVNLGGSYSVLEDTQIDWCYNGVNYADSNLIGPATKYSIIRDCPHIWGLSDSVTLHDGAGLGVGNVIINSTIVLDPAFTGDVVQSPENCVDVNAQYSWTLLLFSTLIGSQNTISSGAYVTDPTAGPNAIVACEIHVKNKGGVNAQGPTFVMTGTVVIQDSDANVTNGAGLINISGNAVNHKYYNNYLKQLSSSARPGVIGAAGTSTIKWYNNIYTNEASGANSRHFYTLATNNYPGWDWQKSNYYRAGVVANFATVVGGPVTPVPSTTSWITNYEVTAIESNPNLTATYRLPPGSSLIGAGVDLGPAKYMGFYGPIWMSGAASIGVDEPRYT